MKTLLSLGFSLFAASAWAGPIEFKVRCDIASPTVKLIFDTDPRQILQCQEKAGEVHLGFSRPLQMTIGNQTYLAESDWKSFEKNCSEALKTYEKFPEVFLVDAETDTYLFVYFGRDFTKVSVSMALKRDGCIGKRAN